MIRRLSFVFGPLLLAAACSSSDDTSNGDTNASDAGNAPVVGDNEVSVGTLDSGPSTEPDADAAAPASDAGADADATVVVDLQPYRIIGRYDTRDTAGPKLGWAGTQIRARFHGDTITADLGDNTGKDQFDVSIDGATPTLLKITSSNRTTYTLASGLAVADHDLVLTKRTEDSVGVTQLFALTADLIGTPGLTTDTRRIEMVGDSITNGYGVLGADQTCTFSPDTEDEQMAWGNLAANQLTAVHTTIAWSGIGLYRNFDGTTTGTMPGYYPLSIPTDSTSTWDPTLYEPDVIVIDLGTNDFSNNKGDPGTVFQTTLVTFLQTIRTAHANAKIILASSPMLSGDLHSEQLAYLQGAMAARNSAGDTAVSVVDIPTAPASAGFGCDYHPSATEQQTMAGLLVAQIKSVTNW